MGNGLIKVVFAGGSVDLAELISRSPIPLNVYHGNAWEGIITNDISNLSVACDAVVDFFNAYEGFFDEVDDAIDEADNAYFELVFIQGKLDGMVSANLLNVLGRYSLKIAISP